MRIELQTHEPIRWPPEAIKRPGYTLYRYTSIFSPRQVTFEPAIIFALKKKNGRTDGSIGDIPIRTLSHVGHPQRLFDTFAISLRAQRVEVDVPKGLTKEDLFCVGDGLKPLKAPSLKHGKQIVFISAAPGSDGVPVNLYYPTLGPHVIALFSDTDDWYGFDANDIVIDNTHVLPAMATAIARPPQQHVTKWYDSNPEHGWTSGCGPNRPEVTSGNH